MKKNYISYFLLAFIVLFSNCSEANKTPENPVLDFLNLKFGMFIHFNMGTFHGEQWAKPNHDPKSFAPTNLDCNQWAKAAKAAKMNYAVFTTKHHDGFCLWDSEVTDYDVASSSYNGDIVKEYVDAFRKEGIKVGLYFSVWDRQHKIDGGAVTPEKIEFTKTQLRELLTNYGEIECIVIDGWGSRWCNCPDFVEIPFDTLAKVIHSIQPNCLIANHSCRTDSAYTQIVHYEATHGQHCPYDNTIPSQQGPILQPMWFWEKGFEDLELKPVKEVISEMNFANTHYANYLLNAAPNDKGLMDDNVVQRLKEIGEAVTFTPPLKSLPKREPVHKDVTAIASSFNDEANRAENVLDANLYTFWQCEAEDKQPWIELDFGAPKTFNRVVCGEGYDRGIQKFKIEALVNDNWILLTEGGIMKQHFNSAFKEVKAQKFRLTILEYTAMPEVREITFVKY